jgi:hypothetical protein
MHEYGYTFHGEAPLTGLHEQEIAMLQLAHLIEVIEKQEAHREAKRAGKGRGGRSQSRRHYNATKSRNEWRKNL